MRRLAAIASLISFAGCASQSSTDPVDPDPETGCSDQDGDGFGIGSECNGPDCNDLVAQIHEDGQCADWCATHDVAPGCTCDSQEPEACYLGAEGTLGIGGCHAGLITCRDGIWGDCDGEVTPLDETCDEVDNDCDGTVDDGVLSECGTCGECERHCNGPDDGCEDWGEETPGVVRTPEGWLTLDGTTLSLHVIWPSSSGTGELFNVDTQTHEIRAAYWSGPSHAGAGGDGWSNDSPSRSGVDDQGSLIIANRGFGADGLSSITKVAADESVCEDRNGNGIIDTSTGWDDKLAFDSHEDWEDECILWHTTVGVNAVARGIAIFPQRGLDGAMEPTGWVALYSYSRVDQFDTETGELTGEQAPTPGCNPYGAAVDRDGYVWVTACPGGPGRFDTEEPDDSFEIVPSGANFIYRVIIDENNTPWFTGSDLVKYDRDAEEFVAAGLGGGGGFGLSVGNLASDGEGSIWVATYNGGQFVYRVDNDEDMEFHQVETPGTTTFGMGCDFDGQCWTFGSTNNGTVIDVDTEDTEIVLEECDGPCLNYPYIRGDITGLQRRNALNPSGGWSTVVAGCPGGDTDWKRIVVDALTPAATDIEISVKAADTIEALATQDWSLLGIVPVDGTEIDLDTALPAAGLEDRDYLAVQALLHSEDRASAPILRAVDVQWGCPAGID